MRRFRLSPAMAVLVTTTAALAAGLTGAALAAGLTGAALAAELTGQATLNAVAFQPLPDDRQIEVQVLDNSNENLAIQSELSTALEARGYTIAPGAPLLLSINTGDAVGAWNTPPNTDQIRVRDDRGRLFPQGEVDITRQLRLPLPRTTVVTPAQFSLGVTLDQRPGGVRLWQGWTTAELSQGDPADLARAMVPRLADSLGQTVRTQAFDLQ